MTEILKAKIEELTRKAKEKGVEIDINEEELIDEKHLNCVWYGGHIGSLKYKGYTVYITVYGDVRFVVFKEGTSEIVYEHVDKNNSGAYYDRHNAVNEEFLALVPDDEAYTIACRDGNLVHWNNNWVEYSVEGSDGETIPNLSDVIDDDVLDAFDEVEYYINIIEEYEKRI